MENNFRNKRGFFSLLGILFAVAIICLLSIAVLKGYFKKPAFDKDEQSQLSGQGIDTSNYQSVLGSTRAKLKEIEKQATNRENQLFEDVKY